MREVETCVLRERIRAGDSGSGTFICKEGCAFEEVAMGRFDVGLVGRVLRASRTATNLDTEFSAAAPTSTAVEAQGWDGAGPAEKPAHDSAFRAIKG